MKLLWVHPHPDLPSSRIRVVQMAAQLEELGATCECAVYPDAWGERRALARRMNGFDAVVMHYKLPSLVDGRLWAAVEPPLVFDFDDAVRYRQRPKRGSYESGTRRRRFDRLLRVADAFACGNRYLEELVAPAGKPSRILPSAVPVDVPRRSGAPREGPLRPLRIGWIGGRGNLAALDPLRQVLAELARRRELVFTVIADAPYDVPGCPVEHVPWTLDGQAAALARLDVGLMPLEDNPWNRGKCAYKLLQYMAAEVCAVGSPVGMNAELIRDGENGLVAGTSDEWLAKLGRVLDDTDERARLGHAGRATVEAGYSYEVVARGWMEFLRALLE